MNIFGTKKVIDLCKEIENLKVNLINKKIKY